MFYLLEEPLNFIQASQLLDNMKEKKIISQREEDLIKSTISVKALNNPINIDNTLRSNILSQVIIELMKK